MSHTTETYNVAPEDQGQHVEYAYSRGYGDRAYLRVTDRSDGTITYYVADFDAAGVWPETWEPWNEAPALPEGVAWEAVR